MLPKFAGVPTFEDFSATQDLFFHVLLIDMLLCVVFVKESVKTNSDLKIAY